MLSTRVNAARSSRSGRVACRVPAGLVDHAELGRRRPRPCELAMVGVALAGGIAHPAHAAAPASRIRCSTSARGRAAVECRANREPRPTSSSESASRTSFSRPSVCSRRDQRARPEVVRAPVYGRSSAPVATSHTSHAGAGSVASERASGDERPDPGRVVVGAG